MCRIWQPIDGSLVGGKLGISAPEIIDHQFVIRGVTVVRWFSELSQDEQLNDIRSAINLPVSCRPSSRSAVFVASPTLDSQRAISAIEEPNRDGFVFIKP